MSYLFLSCTELKDIKYLIHKDGDLTESEFWINQFHKTLFFNIKNLFLIKSMKYLYFSCVELFSR